MMTCQFEGAMYRSISVEEVGDVFVVGLLNSRLDDVWVQRLGEEIEDLIEQRGCQKLVLSLAGCEALYSVLLGKLMTIRRQIQQVNGRMRIVDVHPFVHEVFTISKMDSYFEFRPDRATAIRELSE
jgi:anti-anti-sigma factor